MSRWTLAMGAHARDAEDLTQEVFITAHRRFADFDGAHEGAWLYAIALRTVRNHRRRAWLQRLVFGTCEDPPHDGVDGLGLVERKEAVAQARAILDRLSDEQRRAFVLFEIDEYSGEEIAALEGVPLATVWTRLHHARRMFTEHARKLRLRQGL